MTDRQPVVAVPLRAAAQVVVNEAEADDNFEGEYIDFLVPFQAIEALRAALAVEAAPPCEACARGDRSSHDQHRAVEAVRPETLRETVEEFLSENSAAEANGYIDLHPLRRALVEAQR